MTFLRSVLFTILIAMTANAQKPSSQPALPQADTVPDSCKFIPRPAREFMPPPDFRIEKLPVGFFYIGSEKLWTTIGERMIWEWRPHRPGHELDLTQKIFWFRLGYSWRREPVPKLRVTGRRLDGPAPALTTPQGPATNAFTNENNEYSGAMLTGVYLPTPGCWEITGDYEGDKLSFVVWASRAKPAPQSQP